MPPPWIWWGHFVQAMRTKVLAPEPTVTYDAYVATKYWIVAIRPEAIAGGSDEIRACRERDIRKRFHDDAIHKQTDTLWEREHTRVGETELSRHNSSGFRSVGYDAIARHGRA